MIAPPGLTTFFVLALSGHGGEDHAHSPAAARVLGGQTSDASAESAVFELVLRWDVGANAPRPLDVFLADAETNQPIAGAAIELRWSGPGAWSARSAADPTAEAGIYRASLDGPDGTYQLVAVVTTPGRSDILALQDLDFVPHMHDEATEEHAHETPWIWIVLVALALVVVGSTSFLAGRATGRGGAGKVAALVVLTTFAARALPTANAHGGEDHGAPATAHTAGPGDARHLPKEVQFLLGITTARAEHRALTQRLRVAGRVVAPPDAIAQVRVPRAGRLDVASERPFPELGDRVTAGEVLAVLVDVPAGPERASLEAERARASASAQAAAAHLGSLRAELARKRALSGITSAQELDDLAARVRAAEAELRAGRAAVAALSLDGGVMRLPLVAPIDGVVAHIESGLALGGFVAEFSVILTIVRPERLQVAAHVFEGDVPSVVPEVSAVVGGPGLDTGGADARPVAVAPLVEPDTRTVDLRYAPAPEAAARLRLHQYVDVDVPVGPPLALVVVPAAALDELDGRPTVYVKTGPETFEPRAVAVLRREGRFVGVRGALAPGERVVVAGASFIELAGPPPGAR